MKNVYRTITDAFEHIYIWLTIAISGVLNRTFVVPELYKNLVSKHELLRFFCSNVHIFKAIWVLA